MTTETTLPLSEYRALWEHVASRHHVPPRMDGRPIVLGKGITATIDGKRFDAGIYCLDFNDRPRVGMKNGD